MHVWIFGGGAYPGGCANGLLARERPDCIKKYLAQRHVDALGPMEGSTVLVGDWLEPDETLIGVSSGSSVLMASTGWILPRPSTSLRASATAFFTGISWRGNGVSSSLSRPIAAVKNGQKII